MLAATPAELEERRAALARTPVLRVLASRLRDQVQPLLDGPLNLPDQKALLSKDGGVCPKDGSRLSFDPFSHRRHRCPRCREWFEGDRHDRAWITRYQVWLSERAIHLALLGSLLDDPACTTRAGEILTAYADRYREYPNRDNVLGPTRLFFSTYLESIWLCQITAAASLLDAGGGAWPAGLRDRLSSVVEESASLIASFDEGWSNRQQWHNAALIGAGRWLGAGRFTSLGLEGAHGLRAALISGVSEEGLWFEGENYHFFALRGLLLGTEFLRTAGQNLYEDPVVGDALRGLFAAPLKTVLPDLTLPARGDAPYGVSLFQPRFAELWEVGWARTADDTMGRLLANLYGLSSLATPPEGQDFGQLELSEQEQNREPQRLFRDRLGWKALLWMNEETPADQPGAFLPGSTLLADHGVGVLRHGDRYVSMECGGARGGHGHPDLLHVTLFWGTPWLMDPGTASYVSPSLFWYRSTLAHNAPGLPEAGQLSRDAWCSAFDEQGGYAWMRATAVDLFGPGTSAVRTLITGPEWVVDVLDIGGSKDLEVILPIHLLGEGDRSHGAGAVDLSVARSGDREMHLAIVPRAGESIMSDTGIGPPDISFADGPPEEFPVRRARGPGRWVQAYGPKRLDVRASGDEITIAGSHGRDVIRLGDRSVAIKSDKGKVSLGGSRTRHIPHQPASPRRDIVPVRILAEGDAPPAAVHLGARQYRRSEEAYDPDAFSADVAIFARGSQLCFGVDVKKPELVVRGAADADPRLDNELPDIHSDGIQFYVDLGGWQGFVLVPDAGSDRMYIRPVPGTAADTTRLSANWGRTATGYRVMIVFDAGRVFGGGERFLANLVVNRMERGRERRAGQLVLSGGGGWVYLRGDRESPETAALLEIQ